MIITIGGKPGSGKSTIAKMLADKLGYEYYNIGALRRQMALERGMNIEELNAVGEKEQWTDTEVDEYQAKLAIEKDKIIVDGRTAYHFIPKSLKVFIDVDPRVGAMRVFRDLQKKDNTRNEGNDLDSVETVQKSHNKRISSDLKRYRQYYGIDIHDMSQYDIVIDTSNLDVQESFKALDDAIIAKKVI